MSILKSKSEIIDTSNGLDGRKAGGYNFDMRSGIAGHFKDIMKIKKFDPPEIEVTEPTKKASHHEYKVRGTDHNGAFEVWRRYNHFFELRNIMFHRFMGLYVPPIPEKKKLVRKIIFIFNREIKIIQ